MQDHIDIVEREAATFARLLEVCPLDAPVPSCPGWTVADLAGHLGGIHRWAAEAIRVGPSEEPVLGDVAELRPWFREGAAALVATLRSCDADQPCWTFAPPRNVAFWMRRQAQETTLHRWDAAIAIGKALESDPGQDGRIDEAVALDGIDEVVRMFLPRQVRLGRVPARPEVVGLAPTAGPRMVLATDPALLSATPSASITGPAEAILLLLWRRTGLDDPRLQMSGALEDAARLLAEPLTP